MVCITDRSDLCSLLFPCPSPYLHLGALLREQNADVPPGPARGHPSNMPCVGMPSQQHAMCGHAIPATRRGPADGSLRLRVQPTQTRSEHAAAEPIRNVSRRCQWAELPGGRTCCQKNDWYTTRTEFRCQKQLSVAVIVKIRVPF